MQHVLSTGHREALYYQAGQLLVTHELRETLLTHMPYTPKKVLPKPMTLSSFIIKVTTLRGQDQLAQVKNIQPIGQESHKQSLDFKTAFVQGQLHRLIEQLHDAPESTHAQQALDQFIVENRTLVRLAAARYFDVFNPQAITATQIAAITKAVAQEVTSVTARSTFTQAMKQQLILTTGQLNNPEVNQAVAVDKALIPLLVNKFVTQNPRQYSAYQDSKSKIRLQNNINFLMEKLPQRSFSDCFTLYTNNPSILSQHLLYKASRIHGAHDAMFNLALDLNRQQTITGMKGLIDSSRKALCGYQANEVLTPFKQRLCFLKLLFSYMGRQLLLMSLLLKTIEKVMQHGLLGGDSLNASPQPQGLEHAFDNFFAKKQVKTSKIGFRILVNMTFGTRSPTAKIFHEFSRYAAMTVAQRQQFQPSIARFSDDDKAKAHQLLERMRDTGQIDQGFFNHFERRLSVVDAAV